MIPFAQIFSSFLFQTSRQGKYGEDSATAAEKCLHYDRKWENLICIICSLKCYYVYWVYKLFGYNSPICVQTSAIERGANQNYLCIETRNTYIKLLICDSFCRKISATEKRFNKKCLPSNLNVDIWKFKLGSTCICWTYIHVLTNLFFLARRKSSQITRNKLWWNSLFLF